MALDIVMMGPPGAGKGTQAARLATRYGVPAISTGDMLREAVQAGTDVGHRVKAVMERGELVGDDLIIDIVRERLARADVENGFVLDGFPRTPAQAVALDKLTGGGRSLIVLNIAVPMEEIVRRLSYRRICRDCGANEEPAAERVATCGKCGGPIVTRSDDKEDVVRERLKIYEHSTRPLLEYYGRRPSFRTIDGLQLPDAVTAAIACAIEEMAGGRARL